MMIRLRITVKGIVQGVGFRPFIHKLANTHGFTGWVRNSSEGADMELEGEQDELQAFVDELKYNYPVLALIESVDVQELPNLLNYKDFKIITSKSGGSVETLVSPDVGICGECMRELFDKNDRRYRYPFINCTNCGPRFTIIKSMPYDRAGTSMSSFPMCPDCEAEFADIDDRRYHAQPDCCPECGPRVFFLDAGGRQAEGDAIELARQYLKSGRIIAVKGLGGFHLACDATNAELVEELRRRKQRDGEPFAVMCRNVECAEELCEVSQQEEKELLSHRRPIVLLPKKNRADHKYLSDNNYLGVIMPYTPLHCLLMGDDIDCLVMTSANLSDTPIIYKNDEALEKLRGIADGFLMHDRDIETRCDDSVIRVFDGDIYPVRRSRGYVPFPVLLPEVTKKVLACGAEQKASFCVSKPGRVFPSQHIGDLKNAETLENYEQQIEHFERLFDIKPEIIACDMHPDFMSTAYADRLAKKEGLPLVRVQHHHAHMASCMADNALSGKHIGIVWDGTGYGPDGTIWGGELLFGDYKGFERMATIRPIPLPGGDAAIREIWRVGSALLKRSGEDDSIFEGQERGYVGELLRSNFNCPHSSGMGRLFDGVCAIAGICETVSYEGQGAILLEAAADAEEDGVYTQKYYFRGETTIVFDWRPMIREVLSDRLAGVAAGTISAKFMNTLIDMAVTQCYYTKSRTDVSSVVLSGGVFQNMYLLEGLCSGLHEQGFEVYTHKRVSTNDEGVSLGQIMIAENSDVSCSTAQNS